MQFTTNNKKERIKLSGTIAEPPKTFFEKLKALGPAITYAAVSIGIGELVFAGTAGAFFPFLLLPFCFFPVILKYYFLKEIGKFTVVTGEDYAKAILTSSKKIVWAFYLITIAFVVPASGGIIGFTGQAINFLLPIVPGVTGNIIWGEIIIGVSVALVLLGKYKGIENISKIVVFVMVIMSTMIFFLALLQPVAAPLEFGEFALSVLYSAALLGWVGAGASSMAMYSNWVTEKGYGNAGKTDMSMETVQAQISNASEQEKLRGWVNIARWDVIVSSIIQALITVIFFILGTWVLVGQGDTITQGTIVELISGIFTGQWGLWAGIFFTIAAFLTFWTTGLTALDGYPRFLKSMTYRLVEKSRPHVDKLFTLWVLIIAGVAGTVLAIFGGAPLALTMAASVIDGVLLTIVLAYVIIKVNSDLPGEYKLDNRTKWMLIISAIIFIVSIGMLLGVMLTTDFGLPPP